MIKQTKITQAKVPPITIGLMTDIQYAPIDNGTSFHGNPRYYRHSLIVARHAAAHFENDNVTCMINLGDIIDGRCQKMKQKLDDMKSCRAGRNPGNTALEDVLTALSAYQSGPILHIYGNHELYNFTRQEIALKLKIPFVKEPCGDLVGYYTQLIAPNLRVIIIDSYDIAVIQRSEISHKCQKAKSILLSHNPNYPLSSNSAQGLFGINRRYVAFNGAVDHIQLQWLQSTLEKSKKRKERVILLSHQTIHPESSSSTASLMWNYDEVLDILRQFSSIIIISLAGHNHIGGYVCDKQSGIHFRVLEAVLESKENTYGLLHLYHDRLELEGFGAMTSHIYDLHHIQSL